MGGDKGGGMSWGNEERLALEKPVFLRKESVLVFWGSRLAPTAVGMLI